MGYAAGVVIIFLLVIYIFRDKKEKVIDSSESIQLKFVKNEYSQYVVQFYNPVKNSWWTIPSGYSYVHARWSLNEKGSYGAYSLEKLTCDHHEIDSIRKQYKTIQDIQNLFDGMNKQYEGWKKRREYDDSLPDVIIGRY
jgi:hypothetical protein